MIKKIITFLLNFVMSVLVFGLVVIIQISNTVLNQEFAKSKLVEEKFYDRTYGDIKSDFENYTMQSGLELEILDDLFTKEKVQKDIDLKLESIYTGKKVEIETDSIINELDSRINTALENNNRVPSQSEKESIQKYEDAIRESYRAGILYGKDFSIDVNFFKTEKIVCISGIVVISIILLVINKSILKYISCIGINLLFSGVLCTSVKFLIEKRVQHILLLDAKFSKFLVSSLNDIIENFYHFGIATIVIGVALIILGSLEKMKKTIENK